MPAYFFHTLRAAYVQHGPA